MKDSFLIANKQLLLMSGLRKGLDKQSGTYKYENHEFEYSTSYHQLKWTKSAIKLYLFILSHTTRVGAAELLSMDEFSTLSGISVKHTYNLLAAFSEGQLLTVEYFADNYFSILFTNHEFDNLDITLDSKQNVSDYNHGYTVIGEDTLKDIFTISDVNTLRVLLRMLFLAERDINYRELKESYLSYGEMCQFLPDYISHPKAIAKLLAKVSCATKKIDVKKLDDVSIYKRKGHFSLAHIKTALAKGLRKLFTVRITLTTASDKDIARLKENHVALMANPLNDFISLHTPYKPIERKELLGLTREFSLAALAKGLTTLEITLKNAHQLGSFEDLYPAKKTLYSVLRKIIVNSLSSITNETI